MKEFLETGEVAERLGVGVRQVQRLARMGRIPHVRNGRFIRVPVAAWERFMATQTETALAGLKGENHAQAA